MDMKEYKVGEQIVLEVKEANICMHSCDGCLFNSEIGGCGITIKSLGHCDAKHRTDNKNVIFVEKGK